MRGQEAEIYENPFENIQVRGSLCTVRRLRYKYGILQKIG
jgi:hypothetical protein